MLAIRIFIYGSCVSRDAFELNDERFKLAGYFARSSIASAFTRPVQDRFSRLIKSNFQSKAVERDFKKALASSLAAVEHDILLLDFIDERFKLFEFPDGGIVTMSAELSGIQVLTSADGTFINPHSERKMALWKEGWDKLIGIAKQNARMDTLLVNKVYWAYTSGIDDKKVDEANATLDRMYRYCEISLPPSQFITYDRNIFVSDPNHKWGPSCFHYTEAVYHETLNNIAAYMQNDNGQREKLHGPFETLRNAAEF